MVSCLLLRHSTLRTACYCVGQRSAEEVFILLTMLSAQNSCTHCDASGPRVRQARQFLELASCSKIILPRLPDEYQYCTPFTPKIESADIYLRLCSR